VKPVKRQGPEKPALVEMLQLRGKMILTNRR
jgi:hypothetical protein